MLMITHRTKQFYAILIFSLLLPIYSQGQYIVDSSIIEEQVEDRFFQKRAVRIGLPPLLFFGASAATWHSREQIREIRNRYIPTFSHHYDDYMQYMPAASVYALNLSGVKGRNNLGRATISYGASAIIMNRVGFSWRHERKNRP